jgi:putative ATPase
VDSGADGVSDLSLFEDSEETEATVGVTSGEAEGAADPIDLTAPLAARMRPRAMTEFRGQEHLLGKGRAIRAMLDQAAPKSMILWGPPGSGKTTLARIIARETGVRFVPFSAVTEGIARVREIIKEAAARLKTTGRRTILFCD